MVNRQLIRQIVRWTFFVTLTLGLPFISYFYWDSIRFYWDYFGMGTPCWIDPFFWVQAIFSNVLMFPMDPASKPWNALSVMAFSLSFLLILTILAGRSFCSWVCPFGTLLDLLGGLRRFFGIEERHTPEILQERLIKYGVLLGFLGMSVILQREVFCDICPAGTMFRLMGPMTLSFSFTIIIQAFFLVGLLTFSLFFDERAWCKYLCPFGALIALLSKLSPIARVQLPMNACLECRQCEKVCPMDIPIMNECRYPILNDSKVKRTLKELETPDLLAMPKRFDTLPDKLQDVLTERMSSYKVPAGECINCYQCVDVCPVVKKQKEAAKAATSDAKKEGVMT